MQLEMIVKYPSFILQIFQLHCGEGSCFDLRDGVGCQVQSLQRNIWLQLIHGHIRDSIVDSKSQTQIQVIKQQLPEAREGFQ